MTKIDLLSFHDNAKEYYGKKLQTQRDLKTGACCSNEKPPEYLRRVFAEIDEEVLERFYGCGSPIPPLLNGCTVLDLGCGTGRDVFVASRLVGPEGKVIGVDMTDEQLEIANRHVESQMRRFGYATPNVAFHRGYIEDLGAMGIEDDSIDVVLSNCVINLSPDKERVFSEIFRVLKPGGELYFSDVFTRRRVPEALKTDPTLHGECLGGAMYTEDFRRLLLRLGCPDYRITSQHGISLDDPQLEARAGMIEFDSVTVRAFKIDSLEDACEDYGQVAVYRGSIPESPHQFILDRHHLFAVGKPVLVCGNTASMLGETRYAKHFDLYGDRSTHLGLFGQPQSASDAADSSTTDGRCC